MKVELVQHSRNPVKLITDVASICYGKEEATYPDKLIKHLFTSGHLSTFEHIHFTFKIKDISRACLAQLTRHRHASFSVRSQRYCNEEEQQVIIPNAIVANPEARIQYIEHMQKVKEVYSHLVDSGIKKEDARMVLPNASLTELYMSMNLRELIHIFDVRTAPSAQQEIKRLVEEMVDLVLDVSPELSFIFEEEVE